VKAAAIEQQFEWASNTSLTEPGDVITLCTLLPTPRNWSELRFPRSLGWRAS
jgi:hypothetical protein